MLPRENNEQPYRFETNFHQLNFEGPITNSISAESVKYGTCKGGFVFKTTKTVGKFYKVLNNEPVELHVELELSTPEQMKGNLLRTKAILYTLNDEYYFKIEENNAVERILAIL